MSDAFFQLQKTIAEVGQLQARLIAENKRLSDENDRLKAAPAVCEWKPIATAPKDGSFICGAWLYGRRWVMRSLFWNGHDWECPISDGYYDPTHWMPLPPPEAKE